VRFPSSADSIKAAYRRLARTSHPDAGGDPAEFHTVEQAYSEALAYFAQADDATTPSDPG
jgi:curved DNA-binding protein CbpA